MYQKISKYLLYLPIQFMRKERVLWHLKELEKTQWFDKNKLKSWQEEKLRNLLIHIQENIPYYTNLFKDKGINVKRSNNIWEVLKRIPPLTKSLYIKNKEFLLWGGSKNILDHRKTSGSTGICKEAKLKS